MPRKHAAKDKKSKAELTHITKNVRDKIEIFSRHYLI